MTMPTCSKDHGDDRGDRDNGAAITDAVTIDAIGAIDVIDAITIDDAMLRAWPLPMPPQQGDKERRGHVLILGGSCEMPGAVILAATAALRAGAGKLTIATGARVAQLVALAMPEARVIGLAETPDGGFDGGAAERLQPLAGKLDAVLIGPGMQDEAAAAALVRALLPHLADAAVVLDAVAMGILLGAGLASGRSGEPAPGSAPFRFERPVVLTPHAGEMAHLTGSEKSRIVAAPGHNAARAACRWNALVALKGARTMIGAPDGTLWQHEGGNVGLAISGSGDTLAGIIAGLAARGASLAQATCWGVALHARAGERLAQRMGVLGYLAREIADDIPALMQGMAKLD